MLTERYAHWPEPGAPTFAARVVTAFCGVLGATDLIGPTGYRAQDLPELTAEIEHAWGQPWFYDDIRRYWEVARRSGAPALPPIEEVFAEVRRRSNGRGAMPPGDKAPPPRSGGLADRTAEHN